MCIPAFCAIVASPFAPSLACNVIDVDTDHHAGNYAVADEHSRTERRTLEVVSPI